MKMLCAFGLLLAATTSAYCAKKQPSEAPKQTNVSCAQIGGNYSYLNLKVQGQLSFHGHLGGVQGSYEYKPWNSFYGGVRAAWKQGSTESAGADRTLAYVDVQERLGYFYASQNRRRLLTFFSGFGYRHLGQRLTQSGESPMTFNYNEFYIPVGILSEFFCNSWVSIGMNAIYMPQVYPTVTIAPLKGARWILESTFSNVLVELPLAFYLSQDNHYALIFKPFYEHWTDGSSTAKTAYGAALDLPGNRYDFWGAEVNFAYSF